MGRQVQIHHRRLRSHPPGHISVSMAVILAYDNGDRKEQLSHVRFCVSGSWAGAMQTGLEVVQGGWACVRSLPVEMFYLALQCDFD